jgi:hypothetical protein
LSSFIAETVVLVLVSSARDAHVFLLEVGGGNKSQIANLSFSRLVVVVKKSAISSVVVVVSWKKLFFFFSKRRRRRPSNNKSAFLVRAYMHL